MSERRIIIQSPFTSEVYKKLDFLKISSKEKQILWVLIVEQSYLSANEIAKRLSITRYYVFELLEKLQRKGFIQVVPSFRPKKYAFDKMCVDAQINNLKNRITKSKELKESVTMDNPLLEVSSIEKDVYSILGKNESTLREVQQHLRDQTERQLRRILQRMEEKSLVRKKKKGTGYHYYASSVKEAIDEAYRKISIDISLELEQLNALNKQLIELQENFLKAKKELIASSTSKSILPSSNSTRYTEDDVVLLKGQQIMSTIQKFFSSANEISMARFAYQPSRNITREFLQKIYDNIHPLLLQAAQQNSRVKFALGDIFLPRLNEIIPSETLNQLSSNEFIEIRVTEAKALPFDIFDKKIYLEYLSLHPSSCLLISERDAVRAKQEFFEDIWEEAKVWNSE